MTPSVFSYWVRWVQGTLDRGVTDVSPGYVGTRTVKSSVDKSSVDCRTLLSDVSQRHELLRSCMVVELRALPHRSKDIRYRTHAQLAVFGYWVSGLCL